VQPPAVQPLTRGELEALRRPDVEALLIDWLVAAFRPQLGGHFATEMPDAGELLGQMAEHGFFVQVEAFGGADKNPSQETVNVDVDVYAPGDEDGNPDRGLAVDTAELLRAALLWRLPGHWTADATVQKVGTMSRPCARPYDDNTTVRRVGATYQVTIAAR
jgi:hypothetical protein